MVSLDQTPDIGLRTWPGPRTYQSCPILKARCKLSLNIELYNYAAVCGHRTADIGFRTSDIEPKSKVSCTTG